MNNDYHFQPAAPIIYSFFLITVFVYLRIRRPLAHTPRDEMYRILGDFSEVLDHDLDETERERLKERLVRVTESNAEANLKRLSASLYDFLIADELTLSPIRQTRFQRVRRSVADRFFKVITPGRLRYFIVAALVSTGILALVQLVMLVLDIPNPGPRLSVLLEPIVTLGRLRSVQEALWYLATIILEGLAGVVLIVAGWLIATGQERRGLQLASRILIIWLAVINLLAFYFNQFGAVTFTLVQFFLLLAVSYYRGVLMPRQA